MAFQYPYTNLHELNLDWILEEVKKVQDFDERVTRVENREILTDEELEAVKAAIAPTFNTTTAYAIGAYVWRNDNLYRFDSTHYAGAWDASQVTQVTNTNELRFAIQSIAPRFNQEAENLPGTYVFYSNALFRLDSGHAANQTWANTPKTYVQISTELEALTAADADLADSIVALGTDVNDLKSALSDITIKSSNLLDTTKLTATWIDADGAESVSVNYKTSDYIPVTEDLALNFWANNAGTYIATSYRVLVAYNSSKQSIPAEYVNWTNAYYTVPSGVSYIRVIIPNTVVDTMTDLYVGTNATGVDYEPYGYKIVNQPQVDQNTENIAQISMPSSNLLDTSKLTAHYIPTDGSVNTSVDFHATDYLPVTPGQYIYGWGKNGGAYTAIAFRFVCAYDSTKTAVPAKGANSEMTPPFVVPDGISYLRITIRNAVVAYDELYIGTHNVGVNYEDYGLVPKIPNDSESSYSVQSGGSILDAVKHCYDNGIRNLVVEAGTYDLIAEYEAYYGNDYFDNYIDYAQGDMFDAGIWLQNINVKFSPGAKVICKYTGDNTNVSDYFSAFATGNNVTIDGLVLDAENLRYGIHADFNSGTDETFFTVKNCDLKHYKNSTSMQAIGAGFGVHVDWMIENTVFRSAGGSDKVFRVHNNVSSSAQSKLIVRDCYIDGDGYFKFNSYSTSTLQTIVQVCGCSYKSAPVVGKETPESSDNVTMLAWNNEQRS